MWASEAAREVFGRIVALPTLDPETLHKYVQGIAAGDPAGV